MSGPEAFFHKDDNVSVSSTGDSAYQSQPDATRRGHNGHITEGMHARNQIGDQFLGQALYSPSVHSDNFNNAFPGPQSEMARMFLPSAAGESNIGEGSFRMSDFTNYPHQPYGQFQSPAVNPFTPTNDFEPNQNWSNADAQAYSGFTPMRQTSQHSTFYSPFLSGPNEPFGTGMDASQRARRPQINTESVGSSSPFTTRRASNTEQMFRTFVASPTSSVMSVPQPVGSVEDTFTMQQNYMEAHVEKAAPPARVSEILPVEADDFEEEVLSPKQATAAKNLEETEGKLARTHPLYQAQPGDDDYYHCPNEASGCGHKPTKLKCNYDKMIDSHLKPFRCKLKECVGLQFSSTACLLRHEREAHGMHGHGCKPNLCFYPDCDRAIPGNGFPRRFNLFDHMKRVHNYTGEMSPTDGSTPPAKGSKPAAKRQNSRKRKASGSTEGTGEKRAKTTASKQTQPTTTPAAPKAASTKKTESVAATAVPKSAAAYPRRPTPVRSPPRTYDRPEIPLFDQDMGHEFDQCKQRIVVALLGLHDPKDLDGLQLTKDLITMQEISAKMKENPLG